MKTNRLDGMTRTPNPWIRPVPNILTMLRIVAAGVLPFVPDAWRLPIVVFGGLSDWADGFIARRFHAQSAFGALMDGIADKLLVLSCVVTFVSSGEVLLWQGLLVMARDLAVTAIALWCALRGAWSAFDRMEASKPGKLTTALVFPWFASLLIPGTESVQPWLFRVAAAVSVVAAADYLIRAARARTSGRG